MDPEYFTRNGFLTTRIHAYEYTSETDFGLPPHSCAVLRMDHHQCNCFFVFAFIPLVEIKDFTIHVTAQCVCVDLISLRPAFETDGLRQRPRGPRVSVMGISFSCPTIIQLHDNNSPILTKTEEIPAPLARVFVLPPCIPFRAPVLSLVSIALHFAIIVRTYSIFYRTSYKAKFFLRDLPAEHSRSLTHLSLNSSI